MTGLSMNNRCIPQISSSFASSEADDIGHVRRMSPNSRFFTRRSTSTPQETGAGKGQSADFWRSWEFLCSYSELSANRTECGNKKDTHYKDLENKYALGVETRSEGPEHKSPATKSPHKLKENGEKITELFPRSMSLGTDYSYSPREGHSCIPDCNRPLRSSHRRGEESNSNEYDRKCSSSSSDILNIDNNSNKIDNSKGAIPKYRYICRPENEEQKSDCSHLSKDFACGSRNAGLADSSEVSSASTSFGGNSDLDNDPKQNNISWKSGPSSPIIKKLHSAVVIPPLKGKKEDSKNMTSLLQYNNYILGKDVLDNGITILHAKLPVHTAKDRLKTFKNWPNKRIEPKKLADAGFFYCGRADIVECFKCGIKGHNWVENDKPMEDHLRWNKDCPFVRENTTEHDNVRVRQGQDICGNLGVEILPNSRPEDVTESETSLEKLGIQKAKGPSHPDQIIYDTRLATFQNWPKSMKQKPPELANAGFYYLGVGDQTLCFYCGGGLKDWDEEDDPWEQHALWFPKCNFLLLKKTPAFVEAVHKKHNALLSSKKEETEIEACCSTNSDTKETSSNLSANTEERKSEESSTLCKICFKNELGVVFLPCGHMVACIDCASALKECAVCRKNIQATVRAFLS